MARMPIGCRPKHVIWFWIRLRIEPAIFCLVEKKHPLAQSGRGPEPGRSRRPRVAAGAIRVVPRAYPLQAGCNTGSKRRIRRLPRVLVPERATRTHSRRSLEYRRGSYRHQRQAIASRGAFERPGPASRHPQRDTGDFAQLRPTFR